MIDTAALHGATETQPFSGLLAWRAQGFTHPSEVVTSPALTPEEKRETLASWASDACGVEFAPALRLYPGTDRPVWIDEVLEALRSLDNAAPNSQPDALGRLSS